MANTPLEQIRTNMLYNKGKLPTKNLEKFYETVRKLHYEWTPIERGGKQGYFLNSAWGNHIGLRDMTADFQREFTGHLIKISMDGKKVKDYMAFLKECKEILRLIQLRYKPSFFDALVITRPKNVQEAECIVDPKSLPKELQLDIERSYELLGNLFVKLEECVNDEMRQHEQRVLVIDQSPYGWTGNKNDLSELILAIMETGRVIRKGSDNIMPTTFAREFAAFLGVEKLGYVQDIDLNGSRQRRNPGEFIDKCKDALIEYYKTQYDKKSKRGAK